MRTPMLKIKHYFAGGDSMAGVPRNVFLFVYGKGGVVE